MDITRWIRSAAEWLPVLRKPLPPLPVVLHPLPLPPKPVARVPATIPDPPRVKPSSPDEPFPTVWPRPALPPWRIQATHEYAAWLYAVVILNFLRSNPAVVRFPGARSLQLHATGKLFDSRRAVP